MHVGQAQKWVNMSFKYIFTLGGKRISGFEPVYKHCHIPFDNVILIKLETMGFPPFNCAWSRINDYDEYLSRQIWIREKYMLSPLDIEFLIWIGKDAEVSTLYHR